MGLVLVMPSHTSVIEGLAEINSLVASPEQTGWSPAYLSTLSTKEENIRFILFTSLESPASTDRPLQLDDRYFQVSD